eukprot:6190644-Pleurochrysis_carterae.AAC.6
MAHFVAGILVWVGGPSSGSLWKRVACAVSLFFTFSLVLPPTPRQSDKRVTCLAEAIALSPACLAVSSGDKCILQNLHVPA